MKRVVATALALLLAAAAGCGGGKKIVKVSGVVTLNGQPYKNAVVSFQPMAVKDAEDVGGRGSSAVTDANGRYELIYDGEKPGALIGKHKVRIFSQLGTEKGRDDGAETAPVVKGQYQSE